MRNNHSSRLRLDSQALWTQGSLDPRLFGPKALWTEGSLDRRLLDTMNRGPNPWASVQPMLPMMHNLLSRHRFKDPSTNLRSGAGPLEPASLPAVQLVSIWEASPANQDGAELRKSNVGAPITFRARQRPKAGRSAASSAAASAMSAFCLPSPLPSGISSHDSIW
jgi:hypothetical protein